MRSDRELFLQCPTQSCHDSDALHLEYVLRPIHLSRGHRQSRLRHSATSLPHLAVKSHEYSSSLRRRVFEAFMPGHVQSSLATPKGQVVATGERLVRKYPCSRARRTAAWLQRLVGFWGRPAGGPPLSAPTF